MSFFKLSLVAIILVVSIGNANADVLRKTKETYRSDHDNDWEDDKWPRPPVEDPCACRLHPRCDVPINEGIEISILFFSLKSRISLNDQILIVWVFDCSFLRVSIVLFSFMVHV